MQAHESILPFNRIAQWPVVNTLGKGVNLKKKKNWYMPVYHFREGVHRGKRIVSGILLYHSLFP